MEFFDTINYRIIDDTINWIIEFLMIKAIGYLERGLFFIPQVLAY